MLFSATLDGAVNVLVKRFLTSPVTHEADSAQSPVAKMSHHVLHVTTDGHLPVLLDLTAAPGRTVVFTRTKHRAKKIARQLNASGVPAVELHGNLSQNARTRNMDDFHAGRAQTLVATDIAARGIHVDDVALVIHADPPVEHKAYLHRSGRTARAGNEGTVVTLMMDDQVRDVRDLTRKAGINPTTTRVATGHPLLAELAPGERTYAGGLVREEPAKSPAGAGTRGTGGGRSRGRGRSGDGPGTSGGASAGRSGRGSRQGSAKPHGEVHREGASAGGGRRGGSGRGRSAGGGSSTVYSTSSGGAAAFSAGTRAGTRRTSR
jgi:superfamily II DNA/RNA helicase